MIYRFPVTVYESAEQLTEAATTLLEATLSRTTDEDQVSIVLAGGSTPLPAYEALRNLENVIWSNVHFFWGDERAVGPEHEDSNYRMANDALLRHISISDENIHRMRGELPPEQAAEAYEQEIRETLALDPDGLPNFDLMLLGMGADGHTASLFPDTEALNERDRLVVANVVPQLNTTRITLTYPVLNASHRVLFLVTGEDKGEALQHVMTGDLESAPPAAHVIPEDGEVLWLVDRDAASKLDQTNAG